MQTFLSLVYYITGISIANNVSPTQTYELSFLKLISFNYKLLSRRVYFFIKNNSHIFPSLIWFIYVKACSDKLEQTHWDIALLNICCKKYKYKKYKVHNKQELIMKH